MLFVFLWAVFAFWSRFGHDHRPFLNRRPHCYSLSPLSFSVDGICLHLLVGVGYLLTLAANVLWSTEWEITQGSCFRRS